MIQPYVGEIRMFAGARAPDGWMLCDGTLLPVAGNEALFALLGTTYGGDGVESFALPDFRGRLPVHAGNGVALGATGGAETVALGVGEIPAHSHALLATTTAADQVSPSGALPAQPTVMDVYRAVPPNSRLSLLAVTAAGAGRPHDNVQPFLAVSFIISLFGSDPTVL